MHAIGQLPRNRSYTYVDLANPGLIQIYAIKGSEGPVFIKRYDSRNQTPADVKPESISAGFFRRIANAVVENEPFSIEEVFQGSYNYRSAAESLLAHTPEFYTCRPGRIESTPSGPVYQEGVKHLVWVPTDPHEQGVVRSRNVTRVMTDLRSAEYGHVDFSTIPSDRPDADEARTHSLMQIALVEIGIGLGCQAYVAANDQHIVYRGAPLAQLPGVVHRLDDVPEMGYSGESVDAAKLIDCIWLKKRQIPAIFEVEHSTGVNSGLLRMQKFSDSFLDIRTRYVIVAPDETRDEVMRKASAAQFAGLNPQFLPYSTVLSMYAIVQRWNRLRDVAGPRLELLDAFLEPCT